MKSLYCSELHHSLDVNIFEGSIAPCCKLDQVIKVNQKDITDLGHSVFTQHKHLKKIKKDLDQGIKNERCQICWDAEEKNQISWRLDKNNINNLNTKHLNIQYSNLCNHSCFYCLPRLSSSITAYKKWINPSNGNLEPIVNSNIEIIPHDFLLKYVASFTKDITILDLSFTGGEPFIVNNFVNFMEEIVEVFCKRDKSRKVEIGISTNTNVQIKYLEKFYNTIRQLKTKYNINVNIISSIENIEERAEYVRDGLKWTNFIENFNFHSQQADSHNIKMTLNAFSVVNITDFFKYFKKYNTQVMYNFVNQKFWRMDILDDSFKVEIEKLSNYVEDNNLQKMFGNTIWYKKLLSNIINDKHNAKVFRSAITHHDQLKNKNWRPIFPEYCDWFDKIN